MIPVYKPYLPSSALRYAHDAIDSTWLSSHGKYLTMVEEKLQELLGVKYVLPLNNGTSACHLLAKCLSTKQKKNEVIVPDNVYVAAWNAFLFDFNYELFAVECNLATWNYDLEKLNQAIKLHPDAAVLIVHNVGNIINVPELKRKYPDTSFVEDNCEGFLGTYEGLFSGTACYASAISFFGNKNITSGEGGAFVTNDESAYLFAKCVYGQGQSDKRFVHKELGYNYRMTNVQAAILLGQLEVMPDILDMKAKVFDNYRVALNNREDVFIQKQAANTEHSNWMLGIRVPDNKSYVKAEAYFKDNDIEIRPMFYPINAHTHLVNNSVVSYGECANAETLNRECFILPSYPELTIGEQVHIIKVLNNYIRSVENT